MDAPRHERIPLTRYLLIGAALIAVQGIVLYVMGQPLICACGSVKLWGGIASGPEMSQQLTDWYTYSHIIHGILFYAVLRYVFPRAPLRLRLSLALGLEGAWELIENSPMIIERYRQSAIAQGYFGDSIVNSMCDSLAAAFGFALARMLPARVTIALVVAMELFTAAMIRDNLTLNIIQLIYPSETISRWQVGQ